MSHELQVDRASEKITRNKREDRASLCSLSGNTKPEQQLYSPGSGPLRKTERTCSTRSLNILHLEPPESSTRAMHTKQASGPNRMPSPPAAASRAHECTFRDMRGLARDSLRRRQGTHIDPSSVSDTHFVQLASFKKSIPSLMHLENLPPRLLKKTLLEHGLPPDYLEKMRAEQQRPSAISPRGSTRHSRGRSRYADGGSVRLNHQSPRNVDRQSEHYTNGIPDSRKSTCERYDRDATSFSGVAVKDRFHNWAEQPHIQHHKPVTAGSSRHGESDLELPKSRKPSAISGSNILNRSISCSRKDNLDLQTTHNSQYSLNRSRCSSQSSSVSRENSTDRSYSRTGRQQAGIVSSGGGNRNASNGQFHGGTDGRHWAHSRDRYQSCSRATRGDHNTNPHPLREGSWRSVEEIDPLVSAPDKPIRKNAESSVTTQHGPGVLVLPVKVATTMSEESKSHESRGDFYHDLITSESKLLFDPKNPLRPIIVEQSQSRSIVTNQQQQADARKEKSKIKERMIEMDRKRSQATDGPAWYYPDARQEKLLHQRQLVYRVAEADASLQDLFDGGHLFAEWHRYLQLRQDLQLLLRTFLQKEMRFAQEVNLEHHFWKLLYYNMVEHLRKLLIVAPNAQEKEFLKNTALEVVDNGLKYFEELLGALESQYKFNLDQFVGINAAANVRGLRYTLALVSAQKIFLFLGDLARYREQINEDNNFRKAKQWYVKAQQILPRNGRPYNQLALLSVYAKKKIDAVYFYMRSLMSSNPFESARESLMDLFNETRKKYESNQRKRADEHRTRLNKKEHHRFDGNLRRETWIHPDGGSRVHRTAPLDPLVGSPVGTMSDEEELRGLCSIELNKRFIISFLHVLGKLITKTSMESFSQCVQQMLLEFRALMQYTPIAITSHRLLQLMSLNMFAIEMAKLKDTSTVPRAGRSEVQECALVTGLLMFDILLERLMQLLQSTKNPGSIDENRSKATDLPTSDSNKLILHEDAKVILPGIKVWCDWMMYHTETWNPPPCCSDYKIGNSSACDPWSRLAELITMLKNQDTNREILSLEQKECFEPVRLQEDITLAGFTPLMYNSPEPIFAHRDLDMEEAQNVLRVQKLIYFGTACLCDCDPPVLRCEATTPKAHCGTFRFVSIVKNSIDRFSGMDILLESFSEEEPDNSVSDAVDGVLHGQPNQLYQQNKSDVSSEVVTSSKLEMSIPGDCSAVRESVGISSAVCSSDVNGILCNNIANVSSLETRKLLRRKDELERKQRMQEKHNQQLQSILSQRTIALNIEVQPRILVPDTNCFVDYLPAIELVAKAHPLYQLMVPLVVINELEGLSKGIRQPLKNPIPKSWSGSGLIVGKTVPLETTRALISKKSSLTASSLQGDMVADTACESFNLQHSAKVAVASKQALMFIKSRNPAVKCVTTKGSILKTSTFTVEDEVGELKSNDDRILETALNLCRDAAEETRGGTRFIMRDVVLLTTDRNLRVKALSNDLPVRELPDFIKWTGLSV